MKTKKFRIWNGQEMVYDITSGKFGYYHPEHCVCWEGYDPKTGHADFHGFSKKEIKWLIDDSLSKNGR